MSLRVGAVQTPEILADPAAALRLISSYGHRAELDLLVFPEGFLQGYLVTPEHLHRWAVDLDGADFTAVREQLSAIRPTLVFGLLERRGAKYFNTAVVVAGGRLLGAYRKVHLTDGERVFAPGDSYPVFRAPGGVVFGINICYDARFPRAAAAVAAQGATLLVVPKQNMMRRPNAVAWQPRHTALASCRARETGMWLAYADVTGERDPERIGLGPTAVLDPDGRVVSQVPTGVVGLAVAEIAC